TRRRAFIPCGTPTQRRHPTRTQTSPADDAARLGHSLTARPETRATLLVAFDRAIHLGGPAYPRVGVRRGPVWRWWRVPGWLRRLAELGAVPSDSEELRLRKAVLTLSSTMMASLACVWVATYAVLGLWVSAAIPFGYQLATALSIFVLVAFSALFVLEVATYSCMLL